MKKSGLLKKFMSCVLAAAMLVCILPMSAAATQAAPVDTTGLPVELREKPFPEERLPEDEGGVSQLYLLSLSPQLTCLDRDEVTLSLSFNAAVRAGSGRVRLWDTDADKLQYELPVSAFSINGANVSAALPTDALETNREYAVLIDSGAFVATRSGTPYYGLTDKNAWKFMTNPAQPSPTVYVDMKWAPSFLRFGDDKFKPSYSKGSKVDYANELASWADTYGSDKVTADNAIVSADIMGRSTTAVSGVSLDKSSLHLSVGDEAALSATVTPADATDPSINWSSSNEAVATVTGGQVTAVSAGEATITAATVDGNYSAACTVTVTPPVNPASFNTTFRSAAFSAAGLTVKADISGDDLSGTQAVMAAYDTNGRMLGLKFVEVDGSLTSQSLTATIPDVGQATEVRVFLLDCNGFAPLTAAAVGQPTIAISSFELSPTELDLLPGQAKKLTVNIQPEASATTALSWSSSNEDVATVDETGLVTAVGVGEAIITVKTPDEAHSDTCSVSVAYGAITGDVELKHGVVAELNAIAAWGAAGSYQFDVRLSESADFTDQIDVWCAKQSDENGVNTYLGAAILEESTTYYYRACVRYYVESSSQWKEMLGETRSFTTGATNTIPDAPELTFDTDGTASLPVSLSAGMNYCRFTADELQKYDITLDRAEQTWTNISMIVNGPGCLSVATRELDYGGRHATCILLDDLPAYLSIYVPQTADYDLTVTQNDLPELATAADHATLVSWTAWQDLYYSFTPQESGTYQLQCTSENTDFDSYFIIYSFTGEELNCDRWWVEDDDPLELYANLTAGETYILRIKTYTNTGSCSLWMEPIGEVTPTVIVKEVTINGPLVDFDFSFTAPLDSNVSYGIRYSEDRNEVEAGWGYGMGSWTEQTDRLNWSWQRTKLLSPGIYYYCAYLKMLDENDDVVDTYYSSIQELTTVEAPELVLNDGAANLSPPVETTVYSYTPNETAAYTLTISGAENVGKTLELYDTNGDQLANKRATANSVTLTPVVLFAGQKYYLVCKADAAAEYALSLSSSAPTELSADDLEPTTVTWANGEDLYYAFTPSVSGGYQLQGTEPSIDFFSSFCLYSPTGENLCSDKWWVEEDDPLELYANLTAGETYILRIETHTNTGSCSLWMEPIGEVTPAAIVKKVTKNGPLVDFDFSFTAPLGSNVSYGIRYSEELAEVTAGEGLNSGSWDEQTDRPNWSWQRTELLLPGTYYYCAYLEMLDENDDVLKTYYSSIQELTTVEAPELELNDGAANLSPPAETMVYSYTPNETAAYTLTISGAENIGKYLVLYDANGKYLAYKRATANSVTLTPVVLFAGQKYYLVCKADAAAEYGLSLSSAAPTVLSADETVPTTVSWANGENLYYAFTPSVSGAYQLHGAEPSISFSGGFDLYSPTGEELSDDGWWVENDSLELYANLTAGETYILRIKPYTKTGSCSLWMESIGEVPPTAIVKKVTINGPLVDFDLSFTAPMGSNVRHGICCSKDRDAVEAGGGSGTFFWNRQTNRLNWSWQQTELLSPGTYYYCAYLEILDENEDVLKTYYSDIRELTTVEAQALALSDGAANLPLPAGTTAYNYTPNETAVYTLTISGAENVNKTLKLYDTNNDRLAHKWATANSVTLTPVVLFAGQKYYLVCEVDAAAEYELSLSSSAPTGLSADDLEPTEVSWTSWGILYYAFTPSVSGAYQLHGAEPSLDFISGFCLYSPTGEELSSDIWWVENDAPLELYANLTAGEAYILQIISYTSTGSFSLWMEPIGEVTPAVIVKKVTINGPLVDFDLSFTAPLGSNVQYGICCSKDRDAVKAGGGFGMGSRTEQTDRPNWSEQPTELLSPGTYYYCAYLEMLDENDDVVDTYYSDVRELTTVEAQALALSDGSANLLLTAETTVYSYTPNETAAYTLTISGAENIGKYLVLYDTNGECLADKWATANSVTLTPVVLIAGQKYYLVCEADAAAEYELSLSSAAPTVLSADETVPTTVSWANGESLYYAFTPSVSGAYQLQGTSEDTDFESSFYLYSPTGEELAGDEWWVEEDDPLELYANLTAGETYILRIKPYTNTGSCSLWMEPIGEVTPAAIVKKVTINGPFVDFDLSFTAPLGSKVLYGIYYSEDRDEVEAGRGYGIAFWDSQTERLNWSGQQTELLSPGTYYFYACLEMLDENNMILKAYYSDIQEFSAVEAPAFELSDGAATLSLPVGQKVYRYTPSKTAAYTLTISGAKNVTKTLELYDTNGDRLAYKRATVNSVTLTPVVLIAGQKYYLVCEVDTAAEYELSLSSTAPTVLSADETVPTTVSWTNGQDSYYSFTPQESGIYQLQGTSEDTDFESSFYLYSPTGEDLSSDEWWVEEDDPLELYANLTAGETYILRIKTYTNSGSCSLWMESIGEVTPAAIVKTVTINGPFVTFDLSFTAPLGSNVSYGIRYSEELAEVTAGEGLNSGSCDEQTDRLNWRWQRAELLSPGTYYYCAYLEMLDENDDVLNTYYSTIQELTTVEAPWLELNDGAANLSPPAETMVYSYTPNETAVYTLTISGAENVNKTLEL